MQLSLPLIESKPETIDPAAIEGQLADCRRRLLAMVATEIRSGVPADAGQVGRLKERVLRLSRVQRCGEGQAVKCEAGR